MGQERGVTRDTTEKEPNLIMVRIILDLIVKEVTVIEPPVIVVTSPKVKLDLIRS